jgi:hypothetical protein
VPVKISRESHQSQVLGGSFFFNFDTILYSYYGENFLKTRQKAVRGGS